MLLDNLLLGVFGYISLAKLTANRKEDIIATLEQAEKALHMSVNLTSQLLTLSKWDKPLKQRISLRSVIKNAAKFALSGSRSECFLEIIDNLWIVDAVAAPILYGYTSYDSLQESRKILFTVPRLWHKIRQAAVTADDEGRTFSRDLHCDFFPRPET